MLGIWLIGVTTPNLESRKSFKILIILIVGLIFSASSFSSTSPIIGSILVTYTPDNILNSTIPILVFSIGLTFPFGLILIFSARLIKRVRDRKWWKTIQVITGVFLIANSGYILFAN